MQRRREEGADKRENEETKKEGEEGIEGERDEATKNNNVYMDAECSAHHIAFYRGAGPSLVVGGAVHSVQPPWSSMGVLSQWSPESLAVSLAPQDQEHDDRGSADHDDDDDAHDDDGDVRRRGWGRGSAPVG